jgi:hypothetical protein
MALAVAALVWALWGRMTQWGFRRALPSNAEDVHEWFREDGFLPDYSYKLKAKISEEQFHQYVERFELTQHYPLRQYSDDIEPWLRWKADRAAPEWWDPSESLVQTFVRQSGDNWTYAKRERGYLYLKSIEH